MRGPRLGASAGAVEVGAEYGPGGGKEALAGVAVGKGCGDAIPHDGGATGANIVAVSSETDGADRDPVGVAGAGAKRLRGIGANVRAVGANPFDGREGGD